MKKALLLQSAALFFLLMLSGCGKDPKGTTTTPNQAVSRKFKYKVTVSPALDYGFNGSAVYNGVSVSCLGTPNYQDPNASFTPINTTYIYSGNIEKSPFSSYQDPNEYDVKTGGIITVSCGISNLKDIGCKQVKLDLFIDGKIYKTADLPAGIVSYTLTPTSTFAYCPGSANSKGAAIIQITVP